MTHWRSAFGPWLVSRLGLALWVAVLMAVWPAQGLAWRPFPQLPWLEAWVRLDAGWYWSIAHQGYGPDAAPFLPLLVAVAGLVALPLQLFLPAHQAFFVGAVATSNATFLVGLAGLHRFAAPLVGPQAARRALWLCALSPFSFYFGAAYPDALAFACVTWAFVAYREERWWEASACAALGLLAAPLGWLGGLALVVRGLQQPERARLRAFFPLLLAGLGLATLHGQPLAWHTHRAGELIAELTRPEPALAPAYYGSLALLLLSAAAGLLLPKLDRASAFLVLFAVTLGTTESLARFAHYSTGLFPVYLLASKSRAAFAPLLAAEVACLACFSYLYAAGLGPG